MRVAGVKREVEKKGKGRDGWEGGERGGRGPWRHGRGCGEEEVGEEDGGGS